MNDETVVAAMITALSGQDRDALRSCFAEDATLRALLPRRLAEADGPDAIADEMLGWFDDVPLIVPVETGVEAVADVLHGWFRFDLGGMTVARVVEQHAYCTVAGERIDRLRIICSGFRPVADQRIDALGDGCATLTPRIAAAMRQLDAGRVLAVLSDDPAASEGIASWSRLTGHTVVATAPAGEGLPEPPGVQSAGGTRFYLRHKEIS